MRHHHGNGIDGRILSGLGVAIGVAALFTVIAGLLTLSAMWLWLASDKFNPITRGLVRLFILIVTVAGLILLIAD